MGSPGNCKAALNAAGAVPELVLVMQNAAAERAQAQDLADEPHSGEEGARGERGSTALTVGASDALVAEAVEALCAMTTCSCPCAYGAAHVHGFSEALCSCHVCVDGGWYRAQRGRRAPGEVCWN